MTQIDDLQDKEIRVLLETFDQHLMTLTASLRGRLTPIEEETLGNLIQVQNKLQPLLERKLLDPSHQPVHASFDSLDTQAGGIAKLKEIDSIVYAQAMQYARDLVKAIRQKKEQQRRLELTSQQLIRAEKLATVGQVAAAVAHELGNILTPLLMYAKLIYKEASDKEGQSEIAEFATQITRIANRASDMLRQLVDAARSERAMMIPVDVRQVIDNSLALLAPQIKKKGINVQKQYHPENLPLVVGRPDQLEQLFINISLNAFDAMPNGGDFTVTVELGDSIDKRSGEVSCIIIHLSDTGIGIPPEDIGFLFEPFYTTKERGAGSGLGLFVSYLIIDQHGGTIDVESQLGDGTDFIIKLPTATKEKDNDRTDKSTYRR